MIVHSIVYSDNKFLETGCGLWVEPKWGLKQSGPIFLSHGNGHYSFEDDKVTCKECLK